jgi:alginate O-acetyltransferase complex protein AlgI
MVGSLVLNLGILFVFKYFNSVMDLVYDATHHRVAVSSLILPFGISFYTFHSISYVVDVYRRVIPAERKFVPYSAYVMFFPQLVAGPIARASHLLHQFEEPKRARRRLSNPRSGRSIPCCWLTGA